MRALSISPNDLAAFKQRTSFQGTYQILDVCLSIHADDEKVLSLFEQMYKRFKIGDGDVRHLFYVITQDSHFGQPFVIFNNQAHLIYGNELRYSHAYMVILNELINRIKNFFLFHAGVVSQGEKGILIVGPSSFGKTTLTLSLVRRGFRFLSDEFCPIDRVKKLIHSFPRSLSIREDSLTLLNNTPLENVTVVKNIGRGSKLLMDIEEWKEGSVETSAVGRYVFFLRGKNDFGLDDTVKLIDLALIGEDKELLSEITMMPGMELISKDTVECYYVYRFRFKQNARLTQMFLETCEKYPGKILYTESISTDEPDFGREPFLREVPISKAVIEMMKNLRNRSRDSLLVKDFETLPQLYLSLGEIVKGMKCYDLFVGRLDQMADLIAKKVEG